MLAMMITENKWDSFEHELSLSRPVTWTLVAANRGKRIWKIDCPTGRFALRILRQDEAEGAIHEERMMLVARQAGLSVPNVRFSTSLDSCPALLLDWCDGAALLDTYRSSPWTARNLGMLFGEAQADLHAICPEDGEHGGWMDYFGPVPEELRDRLGQSRSARLLHLDYHPDNVIVRSGRIAGILDWTNSAVGDPRADIARTYTLMRFTLRSPRTSPLYLADVLFAAGWWRGYTRKAGPQRDLAPFLLWAALGLLRGLGDQQLVRQRLERWIAKLSRRVGIAPPTPGMQSTAPARKTGPESIPDRDPDDRYIAGDLLAGEAVRHHNRS
jgi:hypothetical protein